MSSRHSRRSQRARTTSSPPRPSRAESKPGRDNSERTKNKSPEILSQIGRVALPFILAKLAQQVDKPDRQERKPSRPRGPSSSSRTRDRSGVERSASDSSDRDHDHDLHGIISQVAVGLFAFGVRRLIHRRREAKKRAAAEARKEKAVQPPSPATMAELGVALEATARELQGASNSIRRLSQTKGHSGKHGKRCVVQEELEKDAERLEGSLRGLQSGIYNMQNLQPGLSPRGGLDRDDARNRGEERGGPQGPRGISVTGKATSVRERSGRERTRRWR